MPVHKVVMLAVSLGLYLRMYIVTVSCLVPGTSQRWPQ